MHAAAQIQKARARKFYAELLACTNLELLSQPSCQVKTETYKQIEFTSVLKK